MKSFWRGDTLVEVALATGIFSLVAIAVVSVVSITTSSAQSALEVTLTREEIDAQAEAIRFIHSSYVAAGADNSSTLNQKYAAFWNAITQDAVDLKYESNVVSFLNNNSGACSDIYDDSTSYGGIFQQHAFIVNTHQMGLASTTTDNNWTLNSDNVNAVVVRAQTDDVFHLAATYPHIIYGGSTNAEQNDSQLLQESYDNIYRAEGIYIIAVKDNNSTSIVQNGSVDPDTSAYYDFYIRTCWYAPGAEQPSTISTVIRLVDPNSIDYRSAFTPVGPPATPELNQFALIYNPDGGVLRGRTGSFTDSQSANTNSYTFNIIEENPTWDGYVFTGWSASGYPNILHQGDTVTLSTTTTTTLTLTAKWELVSLPPSSLTSCTIHFDPGGAPITIQELTYFSDDTGSCDVPIPDDHKQQTWSGHRFLGFATGDGVFIRDGENVPFVEGVDEVTVYAQWDENLTPPSPSMEDPW